MTVEQIDQEIEEVKLSGQVLVSRFADILGIEASVLKEKKTDDSDLEEYLQENE